MLEGYCTTSTEGFSQFRVLNPRGPGIPLSAEAGQRVHFHVNSDVPYKVQLMRLRSAARRIRARQKPGRYTDYA